MKVFSTKSVFLILFLTLFLVFSIYSCGGGGGGDGSSTSVDDNDVIDGSIADLSTANDAYLEALNILTEGTAGFESQTGLNDFQLGAFRRADETLVAEPTSEQLNNLNTTSASNFSGFDETYKLDLSSENSNDGSISFNGIKGFSGTFGAAKSVENATSVDYKIVFNDIQLTRFSDVDGAIEALSGNAGNSSASFVYGVYTANFNITITVKDSNGQSIDASASLTNALFSVGGGVQTNSTSTSEKSYSYGSTEPITIGFLIQSVSINDQVTGVNTAFDQSTRIITVTWDTLEGSDSYKIYRSINSSFTPSSSNFIGTSTGTSYTEIENQNDITYYYRIVAVFSNLSDGTPSVAKSVTTGGVSSISIIGSDTIDAVSTSGYSATALLSDNNTSIVTPFWSVSNDSVASIDSDGNLTAGSVSSDIQITLTAT